MNRFFFAIVLLAMTGCCSYSQLNREVGKVPADGKVPVATYEVVNVAYSLFGLVPLTTGETWKEGPYSDDVGSMSFFEDRCNLDDNLSSVRHACKTVNAEKLSNVTGRVDDFWAWSGFFVRKRIVKTSCVISR